MSAFPVLKTGAVAQYPSRKGTDYATAVVRFVDGSEQRSRSYASAISMWVIRLDLVDEGELAAVDEFFQEQQGRSGTFTFTDPWDGSVHTNCSLATDELKIALEGPGKGRAQIIIRENRT
jgi:hypothetical protein